MQLHFVHNKKVNKREIPIKINNKLKLPIVFIK